MTSKLSLPDYSDMLGGDKASYETINSKFSTAFTNADKIRDNAYYYGETEGYSSSYYYYGAWYGAGNIHGDKLYFDLPLAHVTVSGSCLVDGKISVRQNGYLNLVEAGCSSCGNNQYRFSTGCSLSEGRCVIHVELDVSGSGAVKGPVGIQLEEVTLTFDNNSIVATQAYSPLTSNQKVGPSNLNSSFKDLVAKLQQLYHKSSSGTGSNGTDTVDTVNGIIWQAGDTIEYGAFHTAGFITTSRTNVCFHVPLSHPVAADSVTVTPTVKTTGGDLGWWVTQTQYNGNTAEGVDILGGSKTYTNAPSVTSVLEGDADMIRITLQTDEMTAAVNNAPCGVSCSNMILAFH